MIISCPCDHISHECQRSKRFCKPSKKIRRKSTTTKKKYKITHDFMIIGVLLVLLPVHLSAFALVPNRHRRSLHVNNNASSKISYFPWNQQQNGKRTTFLAATNLRSNDDHGHDVRTTSQEQQSFDSPTRTRMFTWNKVMTNAYKCCGILSAISWVAISWVALSYHPDPKFADCTLRHNLLTMTQAYAFPLPIGWAVSTSLLASISSSKTATAAPATLLSDSCNPDISQQQLQLQSAVTTTARRLHLGAAIGSLWLAASVAFAPAFAFGYDLYTIPLKIVSTIIHITTALVALVGWKRSIGVQSSAAQSSLHYYVSRIIRGTVGSLWRLSPSIKTDNPDDNDDDNDAALYATCSVGLLWFTILPIISPYPLVTIPTILGKRLSRPASAFTFLGAIAAYCLKDFSDIINKQREIDDKVTSNSSSAAAASTLMTLMSKLKQGLAIGSTVHLLLLALKIIGVDGGGLLLPGRGLWEVYPAMVAVPFATLSSIAIYGLLCFTTTSK